jgi:hypothetical protein
MSEAKWTWREFGPGQAIIMDDDDFTVCVVAVLENGDGNRQACAVARQIVMEHNYFIK